MWWKWKNNKITMSLLSWNKSKYNITIPSGFIPEEMTLEREGNEDINSYNIGSIIIVYIIDEDEIGYSIQNHLLIIYRHYTIIYQLV